MEVRYFEQYVKEDGSVSNRPPSYYVSNLWHKEFRLTVDIGGQRLGAAHRESCMVPYVEDPEFGSHMRKRLAAMVGRHIEDQIRDQL